MLSRFNQWKQLLKDNPYAVMLNNKYFYIAMLSAMTLLIYQVFEHSLIDRFVRQDQLNQSNTKYLENLRTTLSEEYVLISEVHAQLSTIESGNVGISIIVDANIQIGNEVKSLTALAKEGKKYLGASVLVTECIVLLLYLSHFLLPILFQLSLVLVICFSIAKWLQRLNMPHVLFKLLKSSILLLAILHFALPYSVHFAAISSQYLDNHYDTSMQSYASRIHSEYVGQKTNNSNNIKAKSLMEKNETLAVNKGHKISSFFRYTSQKLLRILLVNTVIPSLLFLSLYLLFRFFIESTFQIPEEMAVKTKKDIPVI